MNVQRPRGDRPEPTGDREWEATLADVLRDQERRERARQGQAARTLRSRWIRYGALVLSAGLVAYLWIAPPAWLDRRAPPDPPAAEVEASLRLALYLQVQRVEAYRGRAGAAPGRLEEAGPTLPGMSYTRLGPDRYRLQARDRGVSLTYDSLDPSEEILGDGVELLRTDRRTAGSDG